MTEVRDWFGGLSRVLFVHAHPDDETIATGGTLAALSEAGREPLLITLTRGEQGEVMPGPLEGLVKAHGIAVVRQNELKTALGMLGIERHAFLGVEPARAEGLPPTIYEDSGMRWMSDGLAAAVENVGPDALTSVPAVEALNDLLAGAYLAGAQAIVSYDDAGGYGHPDHVLAHRLSRAVARALELPFWQIVERGAGSTAVARSTAGEAAGARGSSQPADTLTDGEIETHDISPWLDRKIAALRAYATQLTVETRETGVLPGDAKADIVHVGGQRQPVGIVEAFQRL